MKESKLVSAAKLMELAGFCGLDFCRIDNEHAWRQDESAESVIRAATLSGIVPLLRIDRDDPYLVRKAFEIGAGGVIVPHVCSGPDVEAIVAAAKFPPIGHRGYERRKTHGGFRIRRLTEEDVCSLYDYREILEVGVVSRLVPKITSEGIEELEQILFGAEKDQYRH